MPSMLASACTRKRASFSWSSTTATPLRPAAAAAIVATQLLRDLAQRHADEPSHPLTVLQPQLDEVLAALESIQGAP